MKKTFSKAVGDKKKKKTCYKRQRVRVIRIK